MPNCIGDMGRVKSAKYLARRQQRSSTVLMLAKQSEHAAVLIAVRRTLKHVQDLAESLREVAKVDPDIQQRYLDTLRELRAQREQYMDLIGVPKRPADRGPMSGKGGMSPVFDADLVSLDANGLPDGLEPSAEPAQPA